MINLSTYNLVTTLISKILQLIRIIIQSLTFTFVISAVLGYSLSLLFHNFNLELWNIVFIGIFILSFLVIVLRNKEYLKLSYRDKNVSAKSLFLKYLPYLVFLPPIILILHSTGIQMSLHGGFHIGYVNQLLRSVIPPENVVLPGYEANIYWLYHALLATIVKIFNIAAPLASTILNIFALIGSLYWINRILDQLDLKYKNTFIISCYAIFILLGLNLFSPIHLLMHYFEKGNIFPDNFLSSINRWSTVLMGDIRLSNLLRKFLNFSGFPIGVMYYIAALYYAISILKEKLTLNKILLLMVSVAGTLVFHATTGLFTITTVLFALIITILFFKISDLKESFQTLKAFEWFVLIATFLFLLPIFYYLYLGSKAMPTSPVITTDFIYSLRSIVSSAYPLAILALLGFYFSKTRINELLLFLVIVIFLGYSLSLLVDMPDNNQYKYMLLSPIPLCILIVILLDNSCFYSSARMKVAWKVLFTIVTIFLFLKVMIIGINYRSSRLFSNQSYYYNNKHISLKSGTPYKDAYEWIRENTPEQTIVILPLEPKDPGKIFSITDRLPYVVCGHFFALGINEYYKRAENVMQFYGDKTPPRNFACKGLSEIETTEKDSIIKSNILNEFKKFNSERPSVLFIPKNKLDNILVDEKILEMIYSDKEANIYRFKD